jgi:hypothetical protein
VTALELLGLGFLGGFASAELLRVCLWVLNQVARERWP